MIVQNLMNGDYEAVCEEYYEWGWDFAKENKPIHIVCYEEFQPDFNAGYNDAQESIR